MMASTIYITGAASGLGQEVARRYAAQGANLALFDLVVTDAARQAVESACPKSIEGQSIEGQALTFYQVDVCDNEAVKLKLEQAASEVGIPTLALHCAGVNNVLGPFETLSKDQFERVVQINLFGSRNFAEAVLPLLKQTAALSSSMPRLVLIASLAGLVGNFGYAPYCASKFGVIGLAQTLRIELKPMGIKVQVICPPEVDTPMVREEHKAIHPVTLKLKLLAGSLSLERAVDGMMQGMQGRGFYIIPGFLAKMTFLLDRVLPGCCSRMLVDHTVAKALR